MSNTTSTKPLPPTEHLECCCCGSGTRGRQWWNRDTGYGLCDDCISYNGVADVPIGGKSESFGIRGYHWDATGSNTRNEGDKDNG